MREGGGEDLSTSPLSPPSSVHPLALHRHSTPSPTVHSSPCASHYTRAGQGEEVEPASTPSDTLLPRCCVERLLRHSLGAIFVQQPLLLMSDPVDRLYEAAGRLGSAVTSGTVPSESASYEVLVSSASSSSDAVKQLAADTLPLYFHHFPSSADTALSSYFDLLEDPSSSVRLHAIKGLETLAKLNPSLASRLADVLTQLLATEEGHEGQAVRGVLSTLFTLHQRAAWTGLFAQAKEVEGPNKTKVMDFLLSQLSKQWKVLSSSATTEEEQGEVANGIKAVLASSDGLSAKDSSFLLSHLTQLKPVKADPNLSADVGHILLTQANLDKEFTVSPRTTRERVAHDRCWSDGCWYCREGLTWRCPFVSALMLLPAVCLGVDLLPLIGHSSGSSGRRHRGVASSTQIQEQGPATSTTTHFALNTLHSSPSPPVASPQLTAE